MRGRELGARGGRGFHAVEPGDDGVAVRVGLGGRHFEGFVGERAGEVGVVQLWVVEGEGAEGVSLGFFIGYGGD